VFGGIGGSVAGAMMVFINLKSLILVWFAPKVWLMLELVTLIKSAKG
jgi:hypothetical protein